MEYSIYNSLDNRYVVTPKDIKLSYAMEGRSNLVDITKIKEKHMPYLSIIPDEDQAILFTSVLNKSWLTPEEAEKKQKKTIPSITELEKNYCIFLDGEIQINDGGYRPLQKYVTGIQPHLKLLIQRLGRQAALSHLELSLMGEEAK